MSKKEKKNGNKSDDFNKKFLKVLKKISVWAQETWEDFTAPKENLPDLPKMKENIKELGNLLAKKRADTWFEDQVHKHVWEQLDSDIDEGVFADCQAVLEGKKDLIEVLKSGDPDQYRQCAENVLSRKFDSENGGEISEGKSFRLLLFNAMGRALIERNKNSSEKGKESRWEKPEKVLAEMKKMENEMEKNATDSGTVFGPQVDKEVDPTVKKGGKENPYPGKE